MKWFDNIKIRSKFFIVFGLLGSTMISFAVFAVTQVVSIGDSIDELINSYQARQIHVADAIMDSYRMRVTNLLRVYLLDDDDLLGVVSESLENYEKDAELFMENLNGFREILRGDSRLSESERQQDLAVVNGINQLFISYMVNIGRLEDSITKNADIQEARRIFKECIPIGNNLSEQLQNLRDLLFFTTKQKALKTADGITGTVNVILFITTGFVLFSALALLFIASNISRPIARLERAVMEIAHGNLSYQIRSEKNDELGSLANCIGDMVDKISEHNKIITIMDNLDSMICVSDLDYNLLYANKRLEDRFGLDMASAINQKCYKATRNKEEACAFCQLHKLLPDKDSLPSQDFEYVWDDTLNIWLGGTDSIIRWVDGTMVHFQAVRDVTQKKHQEELLQEALQAAKAASVVKSSFLANMSHEIRTPMNAILGITEILLQNETLASNIKEALYKIYSSGDLLLGIINDILDLSKIEAGRLKLSPSKYEIASLINDTVILNMMRIGSKPIDFELAVDENVPVTLYGDDLRIKQILNNLLSNAFKYTAKGQVKLSVTAEPGGEKDDTMLIFHVSDTGQGMTDDEVSQLFDEYSRFNMEANRTTEGTGLGMSITRNLIGLMNGEISVASEVSRGSVFTVRLPQKSVGPGVLGRELAENLQKFRMAGVKQLKRAQILFEPMPYGSVLIVDDVESNLYVAKGLLSPYGLAIDTVTSGFEAIGKIKSGKVYDVVFMDHMMPKMDGIEATKIIRDLGYAHPIVALTANAVVGQSEMFLNRGFDDFLAKPIDVRQMNLILKKFVRDKQPDEIIEAAQRGKGLQDGQVTDGMERSSVDPQLAEIFIRDASKAVAMLEAICEKGGVYQDEDLRLYTIGVHAMKSALANIGETALSAFALKLEDAGREKDAVVVSVETPEFLGGLRGIIAKLTPQTKKASDRGAVEGDRGYLREKLLVIKGACEVYDKITAKGAISELRRKSWSPPTEELLVIMSEHLLSGDFDEVSGVAERIAETI